MNSSNLEVERIIWMPFYLQWQKWHITGNISIKCTLLLSMQISRFVRMFSVLLLSQHQCMTAGAWLMTDSASQTQGRDHCQLYTKNWLKYKAQTTPRWLGARARVGVVADCWASNCPLWRLKTPNIAICSATKETRKSYLS